MIKEIVSSIIEAEKIAERTIAQANEDSKNKVFSAEVTAEAMKEKMIAENKAVAKSLESKAVSEAEKIAEQHFEKAKVNAEKDSKAFEENLNKAVDFVVGSMLN